MSFLEKYKVPRRVNFFTTPKPYYPHANAYSLSKSQQLSLINILKEDNISDIYEKINSHIKFKQLRQFEIYQGEDFQTTILHLILLNRLYSQLGLNNFVFMNMNTIYFADNLKLYMSQFKSLMRYAYKNKLPFVLSLGLNSFGIVPLEIIQEFYKITDIEEIGHRIFIIYAPLQDEWQKIIIDTSSEGLNDLVLKHEWLNVNVYLQPIERQIFKLESDMQPIECVGIYQKTGTCASYSLSLVLWILKAFKYNKNTKLTPSNIKKFCRRHEKTNYEFKMLWKIKSLLSLLFVKIYKATLRQYFQDDKSKVIRFIKRKYPMNNDMMNILFKKLFNEPIYYPNITQKLKKLLKINTKRADKVQWSRVSISRPYS